MVCRVIKIIRTLVLLTAAAAAAEGSSDSGRMGREERKCGEMLRELASCREYVTSGATKPTAECCEDVERVRDRKPECICMLIEESTDPSLALPINTTLALRMPAACKSPANVSDCPSILKLPPGSPDADIFKQAPADPPATTIPTISTAATDSSSRTYTSRGERGVPVFVSRVVIGAMSFTMLQLH